MKKIRIIHFNTIKKKFVKEGIELFLKRLNKYIKTEFYFEKKIKNIDKYINTKNKICNIALSENGIQYNSIMFAKKINNLFLINDYINFFIGSPEGLDNIIEEDADLLISFSKLTFTADLALLLLTEQLYRAATINNNHPYHKE